MKKLKSFLILLISLICICLAFAGCADNGNRGGTGVDVTDGSQGGEEEDYSGVDVSGVAEEEVQGMFALTEWRFTSGVPNNLITCYAEEGVEFELTAGRGNILGDGTRGSSVTIPANAEVRWVDDSEIANAMQAGEKTCISVTVRRDENVTGYGLIEIYCLSPYVFRAYVLKSALFTETDSAPQTVTNEQVNALIARCKAVDVSGIIEEDKLDMIELEEWSVSMEVPDKLINCKGEEGVEFELYAEHGFFQSETNEQTVVVSSNVRIPWSDYTVQGQYLYPTQGTYIDVTVRKDGKLIGYGVIKIDCVASKNVYEAHVLKSALFKLADGAPQTVTSVQVRALIAQCKIAYELNK